jgi:hypothetical protein
VQVRALVAARPLLLWQNAACQLAPRMEFLRLLGLDGRRLAGIIDRHPELLLASLPRRLWPAQEYFQVARGTARCR